MIGQSKSDEVKARKEAAESLQRQVDDLASGRAPAQGPMSFRDFVGHKMAEDRSKRSTAGVPHEPRKENSAENNSSDKPPPGPERE
jgi:hypothetical protein